MEDSLQPGDHIFTCRAAGYSHHGIYVGEVNRVKYVIHFTATGNKSFLSSISEKAACGICGYEPNAHSGVVKTCLCCFLLGDSLKVKDYKGNSKSKPPHQVVNTAFDLLQNGFGQYNLLLHNCEDFATFCKTGEVGSAQVEVAMNLASVLTPSVFGLPALVVKLIRVIKKKGA